MSAGNGKINFYELNQRLLTVAREVLPKWLPGGKFKGKEFTCGSLMGEEGKSLSVNINTGAWADFSVEGCKGGDLISLYAAIEATTQGEAAKLLIDEHAVNYKPITKTVSKTPTIIKPPPDTIYPSMEHYKHGTPSESYPYRNQNGELLFFIARYDLLDGTKQFSPWCFTTDGNWIQKQWPDPKPLYGLPLTVDKPVMIVEGEKTHAAAMKIMGDKYDIVTWSGGAQAYAKTDWSPIYGRSVRLWPDADEPGMKAALGIAALLHGHVSEIKTIHPDKTDGWDAHDALMDMWTYKTWATWAKPLMHNYAPPAPVTIEPDFDEAPWPEDAQPINTTIINQHLHVHTDEDSLPALNVNKSAVIEKFGLQHTKAGPICNISNAAKILEQHEFFKNNIWFDEFHQKYFTTLYTNKQHEWNETDTLKTTVLLQNQFHLLRIPESLVEKSMIFYATQHVRNEPRDWFNSLSWDNQPRLHQFLSKYMGAKESDYTHRISQNWFVSMVARVFLPGCKADNMVILEGDQGKFKSTALSIIGGKWYAEVNESVNSKDFFQILHGNILIEIGELDAFSKAEANTIKKVISTATDRFRPPYGRAPIDFKRQCIFVGTTNEDTYLKDHTGARRFWPVRTETLNIDLITQDREQLFAEAVALFKQDFKWWEVPSSTQNEQEARRQVDEWEYLLANHLLGKLEFNIIADIAESCLNIKPDKLDKMTQNRIGRCLRILGWKNIPTTSGGKSARKWINTKYEQPKPPPQLNLKNHAIKAKAEDAEITNIPF